MADTPGRLLHATAIMPAMAYTRCPKCGHSPLPQGRFSPAAWLLHVPDRVDRIHWNLRVATLVLGGQTGQESDGHDWQNLFGDMGLLRRARGIGRFFGFAGMAMSACCARLGRLGAAPAAREAERIAVRGGEAGLASRSRVGRDPALGACTRLGELRGRELRFRHFHGAA